MIYCLSCCQRLISNVSSKHIIRAARFITNSSSNVNLQEFQSKQLLQENGIAVQRFKVVSNPSEAQKVFSPESGFNTTASEFVIKAQILAGGRGKGQFKNSQFSGVQLTDDRQIAIRIAETMLNDHLVTKQTTDQGVLVERVMIAEAVRLKREYYLAIVLDRSYDCGPIIVASPYGGIDIEEAAQKSDEAIRKFTISIDTQLDMDTAKRIALAAFDLNLNDIDIIEQCADQIIKLHKLFLQIDATQIEINPLGVTNKRQVICVDAKINFDDNARFRHKWIEELESINEKETDSRDYKAKQHNLNFIGLDGSIGCLVNGAGLAMATMDIIKLHGGDPANFLDVGGGATAKQVTEAFRIISSDTKVRAILVNIFGGIMKCDVVAEGIIQAADTLKLRTPIICRLQGTRVEEAQALLKGSNLMIHARDNLDEAASLAVKMSKIR